MDWRTLFASRTMSKPKMRAVPGGGRHERRQHADEGGLARAVRAEQAEDFAVLDSERERVHGAKIAEALGQVFHFDIGHGYGFPSGSRT